MEEKRRFQKNKIINEIKSTEILLERSDDTIKRIKHSNMGSEYIKNQIIRLKDVIEEKTIHLETLKKELLNVELGKKDDEINNQYIVQQSKNQKISNEKISENINKKKEIEEKKEVSKEYLKNIISDSKDYRQYQRDVSHFYKYFNKVRDQLPDYMIKNLSEMPNNKGYIWRGVHLYGDLPSQPGPNVMFEKQKNILVIHEYTPTDYKRFEKNGKDKKILVHSEKRKTKHFGNNIMDYCKTPTEETPKQNLHFNSQYHSSRNEKFQPVNNRKR
jgi:hypothetical protein